MSLVISDSSESSLSVCLLVDLVVVSVRLGRHQSEPSSKPTSGLPDLMTRTFVDFLSVLAELFAGMMKPADVSPQDAHRGGWRR